MTEQSQLLDAVQWDDKNLVPCITQCHQSGRILMMAWMNRESILATIDQQQMVYWSRSRKRLWHKGESSGHFQLLKQLQIDCDGDCLLAIVEQIGGIACHTGTNSCFFREYRDGELNVIEQPLKDEKDIYS